MYFHKFNYICPQMEKNLQIFIANHEGDDPNRLILQSSKHPEIDIKTAAKCIHGRKIIKNKVPSWYEWPSLLYPDSLPLEQCSSEAAAIYKQQFVPEHSTIADFTGGFGVDTYFMSLRAAEVFYFERNGELAAIVKHNMSELHRSNVHVSNTEITPEILRTIPDNRYDLVFLDPARRGKGGERVFSIHDCEPDISVIKAELMRITGKVLVKISPMADISAIAGELPEVSEIHAVSAGGDCKEILLLMELGRFAGQAMVGADRSNRCRTDVWTSDEQDEECVRQGSANLIPTEPHVSMVNTGRCGEPKIFAADLSHGYRFAFRQSEEKAAKATFSPMEAIVPGSYLCEPCKAVMKAGPFKLLSTRFGIRKIAPDTHYYISENIPECFPGKIRKIATVFPFDKTFVKTFRNSYPACSVTARNFPMTSEELKRKLKTTESDRFRLLATTSISGQKIAILTETE